MILYIKESIQTYESPNMRQEEDVEQQKAIREVSKGECVIMVNYNHGHIQWNQPEVGMC